MTTAKENGLILITHHSTFPNSQHSSEGKTCFHITYTCSCLKAICDPSVGFSVQLHLLQAEAELAFLAGSFTVGLAARNHRHRS
jgi:hypothetical protein